MKEKERSLAEDISGELLLLEWANDRRDSRAEIATRIKGLRSLVERLLKGNRQ
jgi:hypothetical protein